MPREPAPQRDKVGDLVGREQLESALERAVRETGDAEEIDESWPAGVSLCFLAGGHNMNPALTHTSYPYFRSALGQKYASIFAP